MTKIATGETEKNEVVNSTLSLFYDKFQTFRSGMERVNRYFAPKGQGLQGEGGWGGGAGPSHDRWGGGGGVGGGRGGGNQWGGRGRGGGNIGGGFRVGQHRGSFEDVRDGGFKRHGSNNDMNNPNKRGGFERGGSRGGRGDFRGRGGDRGRGGGRGGCRGGGGGRPLVPY